LVKLNMMTGNSHLSHPSDDFFTGFENMALLDSNTVIGLSATVTEDGFCDDGCFGTSLMSIQDGTIQHLPNNLPYKALMDNTHFLETDKNILWVQASYPLTPEARCSNVDSDLCLVAIDVTSGSVKSTTFTNWTIYKFADSTFDAQGNILTWMEGFDNICNDPYNNFLFAKVNLPTATATPIACIPSSAIDRESPDVGAFSNDNTLFCTSSGDGDSGAAQALVLYTNNASVSVNSGLTGLGKALGSAYNLFWVWSVSWM